MVARLPFRERLREAVAANGAPLCVGLDPDPEWLPRGLGQGLEAVRRHTLALIEATSPYAVAYKPNLAFFERLGSGGWELLSEVVRQARPRALVIADGKRGDIGSTAAAYAQALYDVLQADACTVNPYLGHDSLAPFLSRPDRFAFLLCRTSNPGASDFQDLRVGPSGRPLYLEIAARAAEWNTTAHAGRVGLVAGATWPGELALIRQTAPDLPLLLPGVGSQGGDLEAAVAAAGGQDGQGEYLLSVSRGISQASLEDDYAEAAAAAAAALRDRLIAAAGRARVSST
ncbi:MAG: orotidine-5'-phosphate decarboxylase [Candidatus Dormibacteria bacterium]